MDNNECKPCDVKCSTCDNGTTCLICKGKNTEGVNCTCKEGHLPKLEVSIVKIFSQVDLLKLSPLV